MEEKIISPEKEAQNYLLNGEPEKAHRLLKDAARSYALSGNHRQAALMYASAASVWGKVYGEKSFYASAQLFEKAGKEAEKYHDYDYASLMYRYAAINYERDGEHLNFSDCFFHSRESKRKNLMYSLRNSKGTSLTTKIRTVLRWLLMSLSQYVWGYGERPFRTLATGIIVVFLSAVGYLFGGLVRGGVSYDPSYSDSLYFSVATITTLGYGDISPTVASQPIAMLEAFCGIFIMPLFIVGLSRKYLRI